jgi:hypothetical protein
MKTAKRLLAAVTLLGLGSLVAPRTAQACGGFFCSSASPVNQAAERIIFAQNDDSVPGPFGEFLLAAADLFGAHG